MGEGFQKAFHELFAAGVGLGEAADLGERVGQVAPAAAGDGDFRQRPVPGLIDIYGHLRRQLCEPRCAEAAGCAGTYDGDVGHRKTFLPTKIWFSPYFFKFSPYHGFFFHVSGKIVIFV